MALGKRMKAGLAAVDRNEYYTVVDAVKLLKEHAKAKFDETVDIAMNLGVDPKHADQMVRGVVALPHGTGKTMRVAVFAKGDKANLSKAERNELSELTKLLVGLWKRKGRTK